jgi:hypothetical protein
MENKILYIFQIHFVCEILEFVPLLDSFSKYNNKHF